jgi:hypothetical protein
MGWLETADGRRLAHLEIARDARARSRGLLGRDGIDGAIVLTPGTTVHTFGMRFDIDVAYLGRENRIIAITSMKRNRLGRPRGRARGVLEAETGSFERWGLRAGDQVVMREAAEPSP